MKKLIVYLSLIGYFFTPQAQATVGVKTLELDYKGHNLQIMIWYPAKVSESTEPFGYYDLVKGQAVLNASVQSGEHPLVLFSHGLGMCSFQSVFLAEFLAENGYIVAAPDHDDAAMCHIGGGSDISNCQLTKATLKSRGNLDKSVLELFPDKIHYLTDPAYRPQQISAVIDGLLADPEFGQLINPDKIGVMGHSFGGWTAEALAGAEIDCRNSDSYAPSVCESPDKELTTAVNNRKICCQPPYRGQISHFRDPRIKATIAFAPGSFIFPHYGAWNIQTPIMFISGDYFEVDFWTNLQLPYNLTVQPKYLLVFQNVGHMTISDLIYYRPGAPLLKQFWCYGRKKALYQDWSLAFFRKYLENDNPIFCLNSKKPCCL